MTGQSFLKGHKFISLLLKKTGPVYCRCVCSRMLLSLSLALSLSTAFQFYCAGSGVVKFSISVKWKISKATHIKKVCMNLWSLICVFLLTSEFQPKLHKGLLGHLFQIWRMRKSKLREMELFWNSSPPQLCIVGHWPMHHGLRAMGAMTLRQKK